jgi:thioredoxin-like negative regulator of GroEL
MSSDRGTDPLARLGNGTVVLVFTASWCVPGVLLGPSIAALRADGLDVREVDIDVWPEHAEQFRIITMPTAVKVVAKQERKRLLGAFNADDLSNLA